MTGFIADLATRFASLTATVAPWFVVGALAAALIQTFLPQRWLTAAFAGRRGLPVAIAVGALTPGCSRSTMPLALALRARGGAGLGTLTTLIFAALLLSPITVALTWSVLGWQLTVARIAAALIGAAVIGATINRFEAFFAGPRDYALLMGGDPALDTACSPPGGTAAEPSWTRRLLTNLLAVLQRVTPYFAAGIALAAILTTALPEDEIPNLIGGASGPTAYLLAAVAGIPLYVCQGEEVPLTYAVRATGVGLGPQLTFLLGAVGTCLPTLLTSRAVLSTRATAFYATAWITFAIAAGVLFGLAVQ